MSYSIACQEKNIDGCLPLHVACCYNVSLEVIKFLLQAYLPAIKEIDNDGNSPLMLAKKPWGNITPNPATIQWLQDYVNTMNTVSSRFVANLDGVRPKEV